MIITTEKKRRSVRLDKIERAAFKKYVKSHYTKNDAAAEVGVTKECLNRVLELGRCSSDTLIKVRTVLNLN